MISNRKTFFIGLLIFIIPFLGVPTSWKMALMMIVGFYLVATSLRISLPPSLGGKKPTKTVRRKGKATPVFMENMPMESTRDVIVPVPPVEENLNK